MSLNPDQQRAVDLDAPRIAVLAAPGSGKTRVLVARVLRLLGASYHPSEILCLTFTRKAGREMRERIVAAGVKPWVARQLTVSTFHSWAMGLLREFADVLGMHPGFTVRDEQDREDLVLFIGRELRLSFKTAKRLWKEDRVRTRYRELLREAHAVDYDMLETELHRLLFEHAEVREILQRRYHHVLVDECQDTSALQQVIVDLLAPRNLAVIGDHAQSLYGFRGASVEGFIDLTRRPGFEIVTLPTNYRSDPAIVAAATAIGAAMATSGLDQVAARGAPIEGALEHLAIPGDDTPTAMLAVADDIAAVIARGAAPGSCAVLSPTWRRLDELAAALAAREIPFTIAQRALAVWNTEEARWAMACLRVMRNPHDHLALHAALTAFSPRVTPAEWATARALAASDGSAVEDHLGGSALLDAIATARAGQTAGSGAVVFLLEALRGELLDLHLGSRVARIDELEVAIAEWGALAVAEGQPCAPSDLLDWYATRQIGDTEPAERPDAVQLMTIHASKGLEWPNVWVLAAQEGDLPRPGADGESLEEQRRLFYVATTRGQDRVRWVSWHTPSRFIVEAQHGMRARGAA